MRNIPIGGPIRRSTNNKTKGKAPARAAPKVNRSARSFVDDEAGSGADEASTSSESGSEFNEERDDDASSSSDNATPNARYGPDEDDDTDLSFTDDDDRSHTSDEEFAPNDRNTFNLAATKARGKKRVKGWPGPKWQLKRWRRATPEERDAVTGEGGLVWREARHILNEHSKREQEVLQTILQRAMAKANAELAKERIPREPRLPSAVVSAAAGGWGAATSAAVAGGGESSLVAWKMEEQGDLAGLFDDGDQERQEKINGFDGEIADMERVLLPEAEQTAHLFSAKEQQDQVITRLEALRGKLRRELDTQEDDASTSGPSIYRQLYPTALQESNEQEEEEDDREEITDDAVAAATQEAVDAGVEIEEDEEERGTREPVATTSGGTAETSAAPETSGAPQPSTNEAEEDTTDPAQALSSPTALGSTSKDHRHQPNVHSAQRPATVSPTRTRTRSATALRHVRSATRASIPRTANRSDAVLADGSLTSPLGARSTRNTSSVPHLPSGPSGPLGSGASGPQEEDSGVVDVPTLDGSQPESSGVSGFLSSVAGRFRGALNGSSDS